MTCWVDTLPDGTRKWRQDWFLHRDDGPAIEFADGTRYWYRMGHLHRDDGPAIEFADGTRYWFRDGVQINDPNSPGVYPGNWKKEGF